MSCVRYAKNVVLPWSKSKKKKPWMVLYMYQSNLMFVFFNECMTG